MDKIENKDEKTMADALTDAFADECNGISEYIEMSKMAQEQYPNKAYAQIFRDIAREEHTHKNHIKDIMLDAGIEMTDRMKEADSEAEEVFKSYFC